MSTKFQIVLKEERVINFSFNGKWFGIKGFFVTSGVGGGVLLIKGGFSP